MDDKEHGQCSKPVMKDLRFGIKPRRADDCCCWFREFGEPEGHAFKKPRKWLKFLKDTNGSEQTYYDSVHGKPVFRAPRGREFVDFIDESEIYRWPSFRDEEVVWENVRVLEENDDEVVTLDGVHLGFMFNDEDGSRRYCINLSGIAGETPANQDLSENGSW
jgi:peptide methionine sulfoxide reductase MsrB